MEERMPYSTVSDNLAEINELFDIPANKLTNIGQVLKAMADRDHTPLEIRTDANGHEVNAYPAAIWQEFWEKVASRDLPQKMLAMLRPEEEKWQPISQQRIEAVKAKVAELEKETGYTYIEEKHTKDIECQIATPNMLVETFSQDEYHSEHVVTMIKISVPYGVAVFPCEEDVPLCRYQQTAEDHLNYASSSCFCLAIRGGFEQGDLFPAITCALATLKD